MRYLPLTPTDRTAMLERIGVASVDDLFRDVPAAARLDAPMDLPAHQGEIAVDRALSSLAGRNVSAGSVPSFLGAGAYRHHIPAAVDQLLLRGEFLTAYTPYQPEIAQGTLQALFEFQTQVALLTGMEVANASMYDGCTAATEAILMANRITKRRKTIVSGGLHPHYRETAATHARFAGFTLSELAPDAAGEENPAGFLDVETASIIVQNPDFFGRVRDYSSLAEACHAVGALLIIVVTEVVSLGAVISPGDMGADIVAAEGQSLGNPLNFGGPYVGLFATREKFVRQMPGRLAGQTVDVDGRRGFVLTLSTREQHIRREKATSNICTNAGLCALAFTMHATLLGEAGLTRLAELNHAMTSILADRLASIPRLRVLNDTFFNEMTVRLDRPAGPVVERLATRGILAGVPVGRLYPDDPALADLLLVAASELTTLDDIERLVAGLTEILQ
jgi:glycine dehydrogenase subunit 1